MEKSFKFVLSSKNIIVAFNLSLMLLLIKVDPIWKKLSYEKDVLLAYGTDCIKITFALLIKIVILYI